jgi:hypothetical protein
MHETDALQRNTGGAMDFASHLETDVFGKSTVILRIDRFVSQVDLVVPDGRPAVKMLPAAQARPRPRRDQPLTPQQ